MARIVMPLPDRGFDVTEVAVPWKIFTREGHEVIFATEAGATPAADPLLLDGVIFGALGAEPEPKAFYRELEKTVAFVHPHTWDAVDPERADALFLAGGHAPGMRQYLGSEALHERVAKFFASRKPVAAICHGVLVAARACALKERTTTCLPKYMERSAYFLTAWKLGRYYRTYDAYVEDEVRAGCAKFERGPMHLFSRGTDASDADAFVVKDGLYLSARWPGDAYAIAKRLLEAGFG
jgi:putative intracellular protease/amidase